MNRRYNKHFFYVVHIIIILRFLGDWLTDYPLQEDMKILLSQNTNCNQNCKWSLTVDIIWRGYKYVP